MRLKDHDTVKFWARCFLLYAMAEAAYGMIEYATTYYFCEHCVLPFPFYLLNWLAGLAFVLVVWYCLNKIYYYALWKAVALNVLIFAGYMLVWVCWEYAVFHAGPQWLTGPARYNSNSFPELIYASWSDIGKYTFRLAIFYALRFYYEYRKTERQHLQLALINKDMQLHAIRQQLNPHFYFNTLNNLYGLAREDDKRLPPALDQLANIMRYVITDSSHKAVPLARELTFLQSYIALERLRYEDDILIEMDIAGRPNGQMISPLLLVQFVENAFKHGMKDKSGNSWIRIKLNIEKDGIMFTIQNSSMEKAFTDGVGVTAVKQLLHLEYGSKHELTIQSRDNIFAVMLKINR
ncbi:sensor histidine kinase [Chitinophaga alhagiae]|uniref:sensor histidine kinase n=1 Tax=Chitinophaga alhagiae TaxID=2203219 RepID=UPI000E5B5B23|nr:sensor histidine kinase [Chitinophaga alhagiae]